MGDFYVWNQNDANRKEIFYQEAMHNYFTYVMEEDVLDGIFQKSAQEIEIFFQKAKDMYPKDSKGVFFQISMLARLILSAVIYGDRRDTSEFMGGKGNEDNRADWKRQREYFEMKIGQLGADSPINRVRNAISIQCLKASGRESYLSSLF